MTRESTDSIVAADYDDAPRRHARNPLVRQVHVAGSLVTVVLAITIGVLLGAGFDLPADVYIICAVVSVASIPVIALFWAEEVAWTGSRLTVLCTVVVLAVLSWIAEVLLSLVAMILIVAVMRG